MDFFEIRAVLEETAKELNITSSRFSGDDLGIVICYVPTELDVIFLSKKMLEKKWKHFVSKPEIEVLGIPNQTIVITTPERERKY